MTIDTQFNLSAALSSLTGAPGLMKNTGNGLFGDILANQINRNGTPALRESSDNIGAEESHIDALKQKGIIGFFKNLEKEKIEKLREKILAEMQLTEEKLSQMPPVQRAAIEQKITEEIQRRMAMGSMDQDRKNDQSPALQNAHGMGELLFSFASNDLVEQPVSLAMEPLSRAGQDIRARNRGDESNTI